MLMMTTMAENAQCLGNPIMFDRSDAEAGIFKTQGFVPKYGPENLAEIMKQNLKFNVGMNFIIKMPGIKHCKAFFPCKFRQICQ